MYNFNEIKQQNMQDAFSEMYRCLAESIMDRLGDMPGETVLREGIRRAGRDSGRRMLERVRSNGLSTNLKNLYAEGVTDRVDDPRVRGAVIVDEDDRRIWEIYSCPMAHLWNTNGASRAGSFFCEEFEYARVLAYTEGKGQLNLSNTLTCKRDDFCLFAAFFREANMTPERAEESREKTREKSREKSFMESGKKSGTESPAAAFSPVSFEESIRRLTASVYYYILEAAEDLYGEAGVSAVAEGLRKWGSSAVKALGIQAEHTLKPMDAVFVRKNFPVPSDPLEDRAWEGCTGRRAPELMRSCVLDRIAESEVN